MGGSGIAKPHHPWLALHSLEEIILETSPSFTANNSRKYWEGYLEVTWPSHPPPKENEPRWFKLGESCVVDITFITATPISN